MNAWDLFYTGLAAATAPWWSRKARGGWPERFGKTPALPDAPRPRLLIHAVSVGETNAIRRLIPLLTPRFDVVVSATTDTGLARARELYGDSCRVVRYPLDFSRSVRRFLDAVRPDAVALVELEVWPNFIARCGRRGIPVAVINGRLSERSFRGYRRVRPVIGPSFRRLAFAAVQDGDYAARFTAMGVHRCVVTGSMKWDAAPSEEELRGVDELAQGLAGELGVDRGRPLIVAGSTAEGEESLLHRACPAGVQLLCAPRHPERFDDAASDLPGCVRRSGERVGDGRAGVGADRFLLDTLGELRAAYALADVAVLGRSFADLHGSDPIEPAALGKPVVIGPSVANFSEIVRILEDSGGLVRATAEELPGVLGGLIGDAGRRRAMGLGGRECVRANRGASARHAEMLGRLVSGGAPAGGPSEEIVAGPATGGQDSGKIAPGAC